MSFCPDPRQGCLSTGRKALSFEHMHTIRTNVSSRSRRGALAIASLLALACDDRGPVPEAPSSEQVAAVTTPAAEGAAPSAPPEAAPARDENVAPIQAESPADAMMELAVRAAAAGQAAAGQGSCESALASYVALTRAVPNRQPPDRDAFLAACEALPEGAKRCMEMAYARDHSEECQAAAATITPEQQAALAASMGRR